ncbi:hypothetical protein BTJ68_14583 [Hortaea werneckii EXF-2000]|uniref:Squalene monooxygenase n=1 Tax=Hortaea werneckii EXF-2000 TaxID=1157616 RepID=A0A1Z5SMX3_HORWE|nr:hypothetical protein BTJ68_14583 [Hortaea werneckii EXF-2000]
MPIQEKKRLAKERRQIHHDADVVIVGAGILGCAIAVALGNQGRSVILLERSLKEPDRIVGELLQPGGVAALEKLGMRDCLEEIDAIKVFGYDVIYYGDEVRIPYPANVHEGGSGEGQEKETDVSHTDEMRGMKRKRPEGRSFHHGRFIQRLRQKAMQNENVEVFEATATDLVRNDYNGQILGFREDTPVVRSKFWGLELIDAKLPMPNHGHVVLGDGAPVLLYQIGTHETRALVDIPDGLPSASVANGGVKGHLKNVVLPSLPAEVRPSFEAAIERDRLRSMPNSWLPPTTNRQPGMIMLGDAMNMRHPLTGGGMTVAFNDAVLLADLLSPANVPMLNDTDLVLRQMKVFHWKRKDLTSVINILAQALYSLFAADDAQLKALQMGCFQYFRLGGNCIDGPVGLLAGIIRQPFVLFYHFFAVALYAMWIYIVKSGNPLTIPARLVMSVGVFWKACVVIFPYIFSEIRT